MFILFLLIQFGIMFFLNLVEVSSEVNAYIFIISNILFMSSLFVVRYKNISGYLLIAYFGRIAFMLWDIYARHIFLFPGSGNDTEGFYWSAVFVADNIGLIGEEIYGGAYTKILGLVFYSVGDNRILGQYINVILGMAIIILVYKILKRLNINKKYIDIAILAMALFPNAMIFSAILLRENFIIFFVTLSFYFFIKWHEEGKLINQIISLIFVIIASSFHSGVIGVAIGYVFTYILYDRNKNKLNLTLRSVGVLILFILITTFVMNSKDIFLDKFSDVKESSDIIDTANSRLGGSQYLVSLQVDNWWKMILFSPIYMFYFMVSPLPWDWRGFGDLLTFFVDSIFYLYVCYIVAKDTIRLRNINKNKYILWGLGISILITIFIFGIAVANAGTAMRHRQKILPLFIIFIIIIKDNVYERSAILKKNPNSHEVISEG